MQNTDSPHLKFVFSSVSHYQAQTLCVVSHSSCYCLHSEYAFYEKIPDAVNSLKTKALKCLTTRAQHYSMSSMKQHTLQLITISILALTVFLPAECSVGLRRQRLAAAAAAS